MPKPYMMTRNKISESGAATHGTTTTPTTTLKLWTTESLADAIGYHVESVRRCMRQGRIKSVRFGRFYRIADAEARRVLAEGLPT